MDFTNLKNYLDVLVNEAKTPGVDCIVYKDHKELFRYFTGMSDIENGKEINGNELYLIFSMTKMITVTAALQLYEKGKYIMTDPVYKYLPEFENMKISVDEIYRDSGASVTTGDNSSEESTGEVSYAKNKITIRDLFTMGAGLDYTLNADYILKARENGAKTTRDYVKAIAETVLHFEPGTHYRYSLCHDVLGALIEVWSGEKFGDYVKKNIFDPLGMKNTFFGLPKDENNLSRMAVRYRFNEKRLPERMKLECVYILGDEYESGGAGLTSCTEDYAVFLDAIACGGVSKDGKRILSKASIELMSTNHLNEQQYKDFQTVRRGYGYGLGMRTHVDKAQSDSLSPVGEFGWDGAAGAFSMVDTKNKISLTYFQSCHGWNVEIQTKMRNALYSGIED
ncbi:MAG: beta-lactamase family protein [Ruminococcaceae bacterium]|nr:beta-lactamase family protein [Oscillospiraceae bacterium]